MSSGDKKRLGEMLIEKGLIDEIQLKGAISRQQSWGGRLGANLVAMGHISELTLLKFLSSQLKYPASDLSRIVFTQPVFTLITKDVAKKHNVIPIEIREAGGKKQLYVAMSDPTDFAALDELSFSTGYKIVPVISTKSQIDSAIYKYYEEKGWVRIEPLKELEQKSGEEKFEIIHEVPLKEQEQEEEKKKTLAVKSSPQNDPEVVTKKSPELLALIRVLIKKEMITKDEYSKELNFLKKQ
ncbi:MAG: hypothetical protein IME96_01845 [Proteobacteria bacterium]|nr:hypothetical protein [Pseudomonadota bacterium]